MLNTLACHLRSMSLPARFAVVGASLAGATGAIAGLVIGLNVYAATAPFAAVELGLPAAVVGGIAGRIAALVIKATRRTRATRHFGWLCR